MSTKIIEQLTASINKAKNEIKTEDFGQVIEIGDGIAKISGLSNIFAQEMLEIETSVGKVTAIAFNLEEDSVGAIILGEAVHVKQGDNVKRTKNILSIEVGQSLVGRVISPLGKAQDGKGEIYSKGEVTKFMPFESPAPHVLMRESVDTPLHTGIKAIDGMIPIGRGQRQLIIGDRQTGKTSIAIDAIINQQFDTARRRPICIYVAIGQREAKIAKLAQDLKDKKALDYSVIISAPASSPASFWYLAPFAGIAIAEYFMNKGDDVVIIYDDLSKHASAYRQISLLLRRPPGREAYPGDIFYLHSRLLERSAKLSAKYGGGSITALPIIETQLSDVTAYIPTNVISITDGQIYLEPDLFHQGIRPAINVGLSVSRVGSAAQTKAMKKVAGKLRLELAQFRELQAFAQFSSDLDANTKKKIIRGQALTELLKQANLNPLPFEEQVIQLWLGINGHIDHLEKEDIRKYASEFVKFIKDTKSELIHSISSTGALDDTNTTALVKTIEDFKPVWNSITSQ